MVVELWEKPRQKKVKPPPVEVKGFSLAEQAARELEAAGRIEEYPWLKMFLRKPVSVAPKKEIPPPSPDFEELAKTAGALLQAPQSLAELASMELERYTGTELSPVQKRIIEEAAWLPLYFAGGGAAVKATKGLAEVAFERLGTATAKEAAKKLPAVVERTALEKAAVARATTIRRVGTEAVLPKGELPPTEEFVKQLFGEAPRISAETGKPIVTTVSPNLRPFVHYGVVKGLTEIDPKWFGTGVRAEEQKIAANYPQFFQKRLSLYRSEHTAEPTMPANYYIGTIPEEKVLSEAHPAYKGLRTEAEREVKAAGFKQDETAIREVIFRKAKERGFQAYDGGDPRGIALLQPSAVTEVPKSLVDDILKLHETTGGSTVNISQKLGNMMGRQGYAVSVAQEPIEGKLTTEKILGFLSRNPSITTNPELSYGSWRDPAAKASEQALTVIKGKKEEAFQVAWQFDQKYIFDLGLGKRWDSLSSPERVAMAKAAGLDGRVGMKTWAKMTPDQQSTLATIAVPEKPVGLAVAEAAMPAVEPAMAEVPALVTARQVRAAEEATYQELRRLPKEDILGQLLAKKTKTTGKPYAAPPEEVLLKLNRLIEELQPFRREQRYLDHVARQHQAGVYENTYQAARMEGKDIATAAAEASGARAGRFPTPYRTIGESLTTEERTTLLELAEEAKATGLLKPFEFDNIVNPSVQNMGALTKLLTTSRLPTTYELKLLERVYGTGLVSTLLKQRPLSWKLLHGTLDVLNLPRSVLASFDLSAPLRQGGVLFPAHFPDSMRAFQWQLRALASDRNAFAMNEILMGRVKDPIVAQMAARRLSAGLYHSDLASDVLLTAREEAFMSRLARKIPGIKQSERTYTTYLNKVRADVFDNVSLSWQRSGKFKTPEEQFLAEQELARFINRATGRGELSFGEYGAGGGFIRSSVGGLLNAFFFSPRLQTSRPLVLGSALFSHSSAVKMLAARDLAAFVGTGATLLSLLALHPDVTVELDSRSADFGEIRVGDTRIDFWAGFQPYVRFVARMATGEYPAASGRVIQMRQEGRKEELIRLGRTKLAPIPGILWDMMSWRTFTGEDLWTPGEPLSTGLNQAFESFAPMSWQDFKDAIEQEGVLMGSGLAIPGLIGATVKSYESASAVVGEVRGLYSNYLEAGRNVTKWLKEGNRKKVAELMLKNPEMAVLLTGAGTRLGQASRQIGEIDDLIDEIAKSPMYAGVPHAKKEAVVRDLEAQRIDIATQALLDLDVLLGTKYAE